MIFAGQGSQAVGMGKDFYDNSEVAREMFAKAGERIGVDFKELLFEENDKILTSRESDLLYELYLRKNEILDRSYILKKLWGNDDFFNARSMDVFISKLRKKLKNDTNIQIINVRSYGYKLIY